MRQATVLICLLLTFALGLSASFAGQKREFVTIDKMAASAPVRSQPDGKDTLGRIPAGSKVEIFEKNSIRAGRFAVTWYRIKFDGKTGWISQYVTTGDVITEDTETNSKTKTRAEGAGKVIEAKFDEVAKADFKKWALNNTSVEWLDYQEDGLIWVRLNPGKYTSMENVQKIADELARYYRLQTNYKKPIVVTIWDPYQSKVWAKGRLP